MADEPKRDERPNILLITTDQQRGDAMGCDGNPAIMTPHMDLLAFEGTRFTRAYSDCPICIPARATIMNSRHAWAYDKPYYFEAEHMPIDPAKSLPGMLGGAGYQTQAVGKMHFYPQRCCYGFDNMILTELDYTDYLLRTPYAGRAMGHGLGHNEMYPSRSMVPQEYTQTTWTVDESVRFLDWRDPMRPFFLWTSFTKPHPPFDPPEPYDTMYDPRQLPEPVIPEWSTTDECPNYIVRKRMSYKYDLIPPDVVQKARACYYGLITEIDYQMGRLLGALRERGLLNNTIIIYTSDHGETLGDFRSFGKNNFYEGSSRVPFIIRLPKDHPDQTPGSVCDEPICLADILPTCLSQVGVEPPEGIDGRDLSHLVRGETEGWRDYVCCQCEENYMLTDGKEKYLWYKWGGFEQLFDLRTDPNEERNLTKEPTAQQRLELWRQRAIAWLREIGDDGTDGATLVPIDREMPPENLMRAKDSLGMVERLRFPHDHESVRLLH